MNVFFMLAMYFCIGIRIRVPRRGGLCEEWVEERDDSGNESGCGLTVALSRSTAGSEIRVDTSTSEFEVVEVEAEDEALFTSSE